MIVNANQEINYNQIDIKVGFVNTYPLDGLVLQELDYFI